jgi:serine/threonine-protein kinase
MATVYLAQDLKHHRKVAVKVLRPELAASLGLDRFLLEIETTAQLTHPHILPLLDSGGTGAQTHRRTDARTHGGTGEFLYYVMPYVEGESLRDRLLREKQLPLNDALQLTREVADALSYAHAHGVVHRDIKPENILLESGHAVVADFGIAKAIAAAGSERLTETGLAVGTPAYMSPEQAAGSGDVDGRSDLYSLGCVLYEMLAGEPPFTGPTADSVVRQHLATEPPQITVVRPAVPEPVAAALHRALAKTPADRFATTAEFAAVLAHPEVLGSRPSAGARTPQPPTAARTPPRWSRRRLALLSLAAVIVIAGAVAVGRWLQTGSTASRHPRTAIAVLPLDNLSAQGPHGYFAGGLHDELITQLAKVAALKVIGRTSALTYAGSAKRLNEIGDELAVGSIVEGSVQVVGNQLRVNVQLIDPVTEAHLWAEHYDRTLDDAFAVQSEIAQRIVEAVGATMTRVEAGAIAAAPTANAEAYRLYLQGLEYFSRPGYERPNLEIAQHLLERALALDSGFALAHAALSGTHNSMYILMYDPRPSRAAAMRTEAETALRLAPDLPQAHRAMGLVYSNILDDPRGALREFRRAADRMPGSAALWGELGFQHQILGEWAEWESAYVRATALDPRDVNVIFDLGGNSLWLQHRYEDAVAAVNRALDLAPDVAYPQVAKGFIYFLWQGRLDTLRAVLERGPESYGPAGSALWWRVQLALWERRPDALLALVPEPRQVIFEPQDWYEPALLYTGWAHQLRGDSTAARSAFAGALVQLDSALRGLPGDWRLHASRGLALAGLGRRAEAMREADWLQASAMYARGTWGSGPKTARARIFAQAHLADEAVAELEPLFDGPSWWVSGPMLQRDPRWDPIRNDSRFRALLMRYRTPEPVGR